MLRENDYINLVNPGSIRIPDNHRPTLHLGDMEGMFDTSSFLVLRKTLATGEKLAVRKEDSSIFGVIGTEIVGYVTILSETSMDLSVVQEMQGRGIGTLLLIEFRKLFPTALTGGLTEAGEATERKVFKILHQAA